MCFLIVWKLKLLPVDWLDLKFDDKIYKDLFQFK